MVIFGNKNASDWGIISNIDIGAAVVATSFVNIPGRNGSIDATEALTGYPIYKDRTINVEITVVNVGTMADYQAIYDDIKATLHGKRMSIYFDEILPNYHFEGRCEVEISQYYKSYGVVTVKITASPYMLKNSVTSKSLSGTVSLSSGMPTMLTITNSGSITVVWKGRTITYSAGTHQIRTPLLYGTDSIRVTSGSGTVSYQEGKL